MSADEAMYSLWQSSGKAIVAAPDEWHWQVYHLSLYGRGMEEALDMLYNRRPDYKDFQDWLGETEPMTDDVLFPGDVLSEEDLQSWHRDGYIVVNNAVPEDDCIAARSAIWQFLDADVNDANSWYKPSNGKKGMMLSFFRHPALDAVRRNAKVRRIYEQLYGTREIYLLIDKVSFNPPEINGYKFTGSPLHWDVSLQPPVPYVLQGFVYLNDVSVTDGAFHCVPGFHYRLEEWLNALPAGVDARTEAIGTLKATPITGNTGDLVIWQQALPHCATPNTGTVPRLVQYVAYKPVQPVIHQQWK